MRVGTNLKIISDLISLFSSFHHSSWRLSSCCLEAAHSSTRSVFRTTCKGSTCVSIILQILPVTQWFCQSKTASSSSTKEGNSPLPTELDFFKYAQGGTGKRKTDVVPDGRQTKKRKVEDVSEEDENDDEPTRPSDVQKTPIHRHRVTSKGENVPEPADSFEQLTERYNISSLLNANLSKSGFMEPTGIQSHGIPILLEVCVLC